MKISQNKYVEWKSVNSNKEKFIGIVVVSEARKKQKEAGKLINVDII